MKFCPFCGKALTADQHTHHPAPQSPHTQTDALPKSKPRPKKKLLLPLLLLVVMVGLAVGLLANPFGGNFSEDPDAIEKATASVVKLTCYDYNNILRSSGSGFAVFDDGIIITNYHVIEGDVYSIEVQTESGDIFSVDTVIAYDQEKDIAILRVPDCSLTPLKSGKSHNLKKGQN